MRFAATHKAVSYLMVSTAFSVLALSGELPPELTVLTTVGIVGSYFFEPQRHSFMNHRLYRHGWNLALVVLLGLSILSYLRAEPLLGIGSRFLCCLLLAKLWNRKTNHDYLHAYIISFFMLVAGSILNNNLIYAICFIGYVVFATWALTLLHLRREMEENYLLKHLPARDGRGAESERVEVERILNSRRVVGTPFLLGTSLISLAIFASSAVIFLLMPRIGIGLDIPLQRHGVQTSGFSDRIQLGGHGRIRDNPQVALRVELPAGRPSHPLYFRGVTFDRYDRGQWSRSKKLPPQPLGRYMNYYVPGEESTALSWPKLERRLSGALRAEVYLEPLDVPVLLVPVRLLAIVPPEALVPGAAMHIHPGPGGEIFLAERRAGIRYTTYSDVSMPDAIQLAQAPDLPPDHDEDLDPYLDVPQTLPARVRQLAVDLTRGARGPYEKITTLIQYLQRNYTYTTTLQRDDRYEPLEDFLFVQKRGHCEYFASALAMMLRVVGVPTRSVNGYLGGEWNEYGRYLVVRQQNAHAWIEAYLEGNGWVTFDPTPPSAFPLLEEGVWAHLRQLIDTLEMSWFKYVIEYDLRTQVQMAEGAIRWVQKHQQRRGLGLRPHLHRLKYLAGGLLIMVALGFLSAWMVLRWGGSRRRGTMPHRPKADRLLRQALAFLERRGHRQRPAETLRQLATRIGAAGDPAAEPFARLVDRYYAYRFGGEPVDMAEFRSLTRSLLETPPADSSKKNEPTLGEEPPSHAVA
ncbi:MAG: DUF3488 and transglutaminase-like domain-containing protein [Myxococcales bacterium]|nr:DUF3488 and transglutaminase-like domain-containing protein [Myxococcota bacterium]MDW8280790.1 DUF3488 and transglutaminase-like domain-containing protein [Myxococcales bacterium]